MAIYRGVSGVNREIKKIYRGVSGVNREIKEVWRGVGGVNRKAFAAGQAISNLDVGSTVKISVNGTSKAFLVVHQGNPSTSLYDSSCAGTWMLMKDIYEKRQWDAEENNSYADSDIHAYLNSTFLNLIAIKDSIKQVKIPYRPGSGSNKTVNSGANGLSCKVFLTSYTELGGSNSYAPIDGEKLPYFSSSAIRIAYLNGTAVSWSTRTPRTSGVNVWRVTDSGATGAYMSPTSSDYGVRPAFILPSDFEVSSSADSDGDYTII